MRTDLRAHVETSWVTNAEGEMSKVMETDAVFEISFVMAVASPAWQNVSRYRAAVFTTEVGNGHSLRAFGGAHLVQLSREPVGRSVGVTECIIRFTSGPHSLFLRPMPATPTVHVFETTI